MIKDEIDKLKSDKESLPATGQHTTAELPEIFSGDGTQDVEPWIKKLEGFYRNYYPKDEDYDRKLVSNLVFHLAGPALAWYHDVSMYRERRFWMVIKDKFLRRFMSVREREDFESVQMEQWENLGHFMIRASNAYYRLDLTQEEICHRFRSALEKRCGIDLSSAPKYYPEAIMMVPKATKFSSSDSDTKIFPDPYDELGIRETDYLLRVEDVPRNINYLWDPWFERSSTRRELKKAVHHDAVKGHYVRVRVGGLTYTVPITPHAEVSCIDVHILRDIVAKTSFRDCQISPAKEAVNFGNPCTFSITNVHFRLKLRFKIDKVTYTGYFLVLPKLVCNMILGKDFLDGYRVSVTARENGNQRFTFSRGDK